jgi:conjugal transfer pilus assembly protein TraU
MKGWVLSAAVVAGLLAALLVMGRAHATDTRCPDAEVLSAKLITDVCWACLFPVKIAGLELFRSDKPDRASDAWFCTCDDHLGVPHFGMAVGMWEPARIIEAVHSPRCSPTLGGIRLPIGSRRLLGTAGGRSDDAGDGAFFNYHWFAFPLLIILELIWEDRCNADGYVDIDLMYLSELDPTWNNSELAFFTNPEAAAFANPVAQAACLTDGVAATAGNPIDELFWCAGTWGFLYPFAGKQADGSRVRESSLTVARSLAALHRRGLARRTMGNDAMCNAPIDLFIPKSQYKITQFYPLPETQRAHVIGESPFRWGQWRSIAGTGESHVYMLWRWNDCCATLF